MNEIDYTFLKEKMLENDKKPGEGFAKFVICMVAAQCKLDSEYLIDYLNGDKEVTEEIDEVLTKLYHFPKGFLIDLDKRYKDKTIIC